MQSTSTLGGQRRGTRTERDRLKGCRSSPSPAGTRPKTPVVVETVGGTELCTRTCFFLNGPGFLLEWQLGNMTLVPRGSGPWAQAVPIPRWHRAPQGPPGCAGKEPCPPPPLRPPRPLTCLEPRPLRDRVRGCGPSPFCHVPDLSKRCYSQETRGRNSCASVWGRTARLLSGGVAGGALLTRGRSL